MSRKAIILLSVVMFCQCLFGTSGLGGGRGLFRIQDAQNEGPNMLSISSRFMFRRDNLGSLRQYRGPFFAPEFSYSPLNNLEFFGSIAGNFTYQSVPDKDYHYDWHGEIFGSKVSFLDLPVAKFGVLGFVNLARKNKVFLDSAMIPGPGYRALVTLDLADAFLTLPTFTLNGGETFGEDRVIFLGCGTEMATRLFRVFLEASTEQKWGEAIFGNSAKIRITPGIRARFPFGLGLEGGVEFGLTAATPDYVAILGINYTGPLIPARPQAFGTITGRVVDALTGAPIPAQIKMLKYRLGSVRNDPKTGVFTIRNVPVGVTVVQVQNSLFHSQSLPLTIKEDEVTAANFELKKIHVSGSFAGMVTDAKNDQPLQASITIQGDKIIEIESDPFTGFFQLENIPVGVHTVYTKKDGYSSAIALLEVKENESTIKNFKLVKAGTRIVLHGLKFNFDKATIKPESYSILDDAAKILLENPNISVEIQGYTDSSGSYEYNQRLSLKRAYAVVNYIVQNYGVNPVRLLAKGFGEMNPIAPNDSKEGRIMNRRVEFLVLEHKK
ncbi:MAG: OmpA family protein [candidate division WOR-3 bacterium]|nr:OmpA family protein [candidate division WOR-3 bacterium]